MEQVAPGLLFNIIFIIIVVPVVYLSRKLLKKLRQRQSFIDFTTQTELQKLQLGELESLGLDELKQTLDKQQTEAYVYIPTSFSPLKTRSNVDQVSGSVRHSITNVIRVLEIGQLALDELINDGCLKCEGKITGNPYTVKEYRLRYTPYGPFNYRIEHAGTGEIYPFCMSCQEEAIEKSGVKHEAPADVVAAHI